MFTSLNNYCMSDYLQCCTPYPGGHAIELADCSAECWSNLFILEIQSRQVWHFEGEKFLLFPFQTGCRYIY